MCVPVYCYIERVDYVEGTTIVGVSRAREHFEQRKQQKAPVQTQREKIYLQL